MDEPWLVAGLGNPGTEYASTRHNAGAMVLQLLCDRFDARLRKVRFVSAEAADVRHQGTPLVLARATTFMNVSGPPLASVARKRGVRVGQVIAVHDEIDLPFGALRIKKGGSTAGHHGLDSMVEAFRSADFYRVRIGIGRPLRRSQNVDFVLKAFAKNERREIEVVLEEAVDAVLSLVTDGLGQTQSRFNRPGVAAT